MVLRVTRRQLEVADDAELFRLLREAHFTTVFVGIESPNADALAEAKKTQNTRDDITASVRRFHEHGIQVRAGMIVGFDADTTAILEQQAERGGHDTARLGASLTFFSRLFSFSVFPDFFDWCWRGDLSAIGSSSARGR